MKESRLLSHRQDWLLLEANFESVETILAVNMYNPGCICMQNIHASEDGCTRCWLFCSYI